MTLFFSLEEPFVANVERTFPKFESEEEEQQYWAEHDPFDYFTEPADVVLRIQNHKKDRMVSFRLDAPLHDELKQVAKKHGLPYQRLMRELLRQSLTNMRARESKSATGRRG